MAEATNPKYKKGLVIFIDILGSQNQNDFSKLYEINNTFHTMLNANEKNDKAYVVYQRTIHTFSDCAYIIYDFKEGVPPQKQILGQLFEVALCNCEHLLLHFLSKNFVFRGGVAYGDLYYEKDRTILFGPAVNEAYLLESKVAIYPRIALSNFVAEKIIENWNNTVLEMDNPKTTEEIMTYYLLGNVKRIQGCIVKKDFDGIYMMHYLNSIEKRVGVASFTNMPNDQFIDNCKALCNSQINVNNGKHYITQKYTWLLEYIDSLQLDT